MQQLWSMHELPAGLSQDSRNIELRGAGLLDTAIKFPLHKETLHSSCACWSSFSSHWPYPVHQLSAAKHFCHINSSSASENLASHSWESPGAELSFRCNPSGSVSEFPPANRRCTASKQAHRSAQRSLLERSEEAIALHSALDCRCWFESTGGKGARRRWRPSTRKFYAYIDPCWSQHHPSVWSCACWCGF